MQYAYIFFNNLKKTVKIHLKVIFLFRYFLVKFANCLNSFSLHAGSN